MTPLGWHLLGFLSSNKAVTCSRSPLSSQSWSTTAMLLTWTQKHGVVSVTTVISANHHHLESVYSTGKGKQTGLSFCFINAGSTSVNLGSGSERPATRGVTTGEAKQAIAWGPQTGRGPRGELITLVHSNNNSVRTPLKSMISHGKPCPETSYRVHVTLAC